jgi:hypothetical protein
MSGHVAVVLLGIAPLVAGGGAERFFADVFARYRTWARRQHRLTFVTDARTVRRLREVGRLTSEEDVEVLPDAPWGTAALAGSLALRRTIARLGVDLIHIPLIAPRYLPYLWRCSASSARSPRLCVSVVDANLAHVFFDRRARRGREQRKAVALHGLYFRTVRLDGIYTWFAASRSCAWRSAATSMASGSRRARGRSVASCSPVAWWRASGPCCFSTVCDGRWTVRPARSTAGPSRCSVGDICEAGSRRTCGPTGWGGE